MAVALPGQTLPPGVLTFGEDGKECGASPNSCPCFSEDPQTTQNNAFDGWQVEYLPYGTKSDKGRRANMEDSHTIKRDLMVLHISCYPKEGYLPKVLETQSMASELCSRSGDGSPRSPGSLELLHGSSEDSQDFINNNGQPSRKVYSSRVLYAAVFDGHGGSTVSRILAEKLHIVIKDKVNGCILSVLQLVWIMKESFLAMDANLGESARTAGSTGVVSLVSRHHIVVANCGDSRGVLWRDNRLVRLTRDHKPNHSDEEERIVKAGGRVCNYNGIRVMGLLAMSRAFGDHCLSEFGITAEPEVTVIERSQTDQFIILASDGLWDVVSDAEACALTRRCFARAQERSTPKDTAARVAANVLNRVALDKGSSDNVTVVVLDLRVP